MKGFDVIINIIITLIVIWSFISKLRKKRTTKPSDTSEKSSGFGKIMGDLISEISKADTDKRKTSLKNTGWERIISQKEEELLIDWDEADEIIKAEPQLVRASSEKKGTLPETQRRDISEENEAIPKCSKKSVKRLRRAIVWSEILAPPVSLR